VSRVEQRRYGLAHEILHRTLDSRAAAEVEGFAETTGSNSRPVGWS
jgi:hypothetical protein